MILVCGSIYSIFRNTCARWESFKYLASPANNTGGNISITDGNFKLNPFAEQATFYSDNSNGPIKNQGETFYYGQTSFEYSQLNRIKEIAAPGNSWAGQMYQSAESDRHSIKMKYYVNTSVDAVRIWNVTLGVIGSFSTYASSSTYSAGVLVKTISVDEHNKQVVEFKDRNGRVVLKKVQLTAVSDTGSGSGHTGWLCTYYLYDALSNLRCVIQPRGVELIASNWALTNSIILAEQCFRYEYDSHNRMIIKKIPGAKEVYMVYDAKDRLVMTQDGNLRIATKWLVTKYDNLNRPKETGLWTNSTAFTTHLMNADTSTSYPTTSTGYEQLTGTHYDDYANIPGGLTSSFDGSWSSYFINSYNTSPVYSQQQTASLQTFGLVTWTQTKVLGTSNTFLYAVNIYDDKGRVIQQKTTNLTGGTDVLTTQYNWSGQPIISVQKQVKSGTPSQTTVIVSQITYDDLGRVLQIDKKVQNTNVNNNVMPSAYTTMVKNEYDALGRLIKKNIGNKPGASAGTPLAKMDYQYNIQGWLLSVNKDYLSASSNSDQYFAFELGYDKNPQFAGSWNGYYQYNGNIGGTIWKSEGDQEKRKYDFTYDAANRILKADFNQYVSGSTFDKSAGIDFSIGGNTTTGGTMKYDANGNIMEMWQYGLKLNTSPVIDKLTYTYRNSNYSNKLAKVVDGINTSDNGKLGDFKDGTNGSTNDYSYDTTGNLILDNNKGISSITYNYLNLPEVITITGKGTITYTYDAVGVKLKKFTVDNTVGGKTITTITTYISGIVYESKTTSPSDQNDYPDRLQFVPHEEGRIRFRATDSTFQYDYFLKDHLGNVRMVLAEEVDQSIYPAATLEGTYTDPNTAIGYEKNFYTINTANVVDNSQAQGITAYQNNNGIANPYPYLPVNNSGNTNVNSNSTKVYKLQATSSKGENGLGITLKVMSGDKIDIFGKSYYPTANSGGLNYNIPVLDIITGLLGAPVSAAASKGFTATDLNGQSEITSPITGFLSDAGRGSGTVPKAYINWILFDENFKFVNGNFSRVGSAGVVKSHYGDASMQNIQVSKNGYLYVYVSNESPVAVFFDNLQVVHAKGPILEETHYYPFGLTMAGISSKALAFGEPENKRKWNAGSELASKEFSDGSGLELYETSYRSLDPQVGRFWQIDPELEAQESFSPYESMGNNPISNVDPLGDFKRRFGAWLYKVFHGGGTVGQNKYGEWYVSKTEASSSEDGNVTVTSKVTYGKGRNRISALREKLVEEADRERIANDLTEEGLWDPNLTPEEARQNAKSYLNLLLPNATFRPGTVLINSTRIKASNLKELKVLIKQLSKPGSELTKRELNQLKKLVEQFGGKLRYDLNPVKGKILKPHVQVEGLGSSIQSRHIWLSEKTVEKIL